MTDYKILYRFKDTEPGDIGSITGTLSDIYSALRGKIHKIDEFQLMDADLQIIARNRGDAIILYEQLPAHFNLFIKDFRLRKGRKESIMAVNRNKKKEDKTVDAAPALVIEVLKAKDFTKDGEDGCNISFDMKVNGVTIYGCWYREGKDKKGEDYQLVSFPSKQGKDGKYYSHAYVKLQQSDIDFISIEIERLL